MAGRQPSSSILSFLGRPAPSSQYVCRPCQHALHQHRQTQHPPTNKTQTRSLHRHVTPGAVPKPTPFVPDVPTFLSLIGRNLSTHASKIQSWNDLFTLSSTQLKDLGIEPARTRRYLLRWRDKFRKGEYGIGGDFQHVSSGRGELRVVEVPSLRPQNVVDDRGVPVQATLNTTPGMTKLIVNVPVGATTYTLNPGQTTADLKKPAFVKLLDGQTIKGSYVQTVAGTSGKVATVKVTEGMWEDRRGHKVHGGERRRAETLHKARVAERKKNER